MGLSFHRKCGFELSTATSQATINNRHLAAIVVIFGGLFWLLRRVAHHINHISMS